MEIKKTGIKTVNGKTTRIQLSLEKSEEKVGNDVQLMELLRAFLLIEDGSRQIRCMSYTHSPSEGGIIKMEVEIL